MEDLLDTTSFDTFEEVLDAVGPFGRWQLGMILVHAVSYIFASMIETGMLFMEHRPMFGCAGNVNISTIYFNSTCASNGSCSAFVFDNSEMMSTTVTEWKQVCDQAYLAPMSKAFYMSGVFVGSLLGGLLGDLFGRKPVALGCEFLLGAFGCLTAVVGNTFQYAILRFLVGLLSFAYIYQIFLIQQETTTATYRSYVGGLFSLPYSSSILICTGFAYVLPGWRTLILAVSAPIVLIVPSYYWLIDESPRWLLVHGERAKAERLLRKAAARNGRVLPASFNVEKLSPHVQEKKHEMSGKRRVSVRKEDIRSKFHRSAIYRLFDSRILTVRLLNSFVNWFICGLVFYGLTWSVSDVAYEGSLFAKNAISGTIEVFGKFLCVPLLCLGRQRATVMCMFTAGVSLLFIGLSPTDWSNAHLPLLYVARLTTAAHYQIFLVFTAELFPTSVRSQAVGTGCTMLGLGSIPTAYILALRHSVSPSTPELIYGSCCLLSCVLLLALPETKTSALTEHVEDGAMLMSWFERNCLHTSNQEEANENGSAFRIDGKDTDGNVTSLLSSQT